jgi:hypothetical protein
MGHGFFRVNQPGTAVARAKLEFFEKILFIRSGIVVLSSVLVEIEN